MISYKPKEIKKILKKHGYEFVRSRGDHEIYKNKRGKEITVTSTHMNICVATRLLKEINNA